MKPFVIRVHPEAVDALEELMDWTDYKDVNEAMCEAIVSWRDLKLKANEGFTQIIVRNPVTQDVQEYKPKRGGKG